MAVSVEQEGRDSVEVVVERIGGNLEERSVQFIIEPDGASEFYGAPAGLVFEPGVSTRTATILPRNEGEPEVMCCFVSPVLFTYNKITHCIMCL